MNKEFVFTESPSGIWLEEKARLESTKANW